MENHCVRLRHPATVRSQFKAFGDALADVVDFIIAGFAIVIPPILAIVLWFQISQIFDFVAEASYDTLIILADGLVL